ncbi:MAG: hypothetical protein ACI9TI_001321 [Natronomonas sp.]|mgnify:CR=1 FL=1|jgi:hypothetical protein
MSGDIKDSADSPPIGSRPSLESADPELGVPAESEVQRADPPVPSLDRAATRGIGQLDDDVLGAEFDVGVRLVLAAVGEVASVSCDDSTRLGVVAERLESHQERCVVERGPLGSLIRIVHAGGSGAADLSPRFTARRAGGVTVGMKMNTYQSRG